MASADPYYCQPQCTDRVNLLKTNQVSQMYEVLARILANALPGQKAEVRTGCAVMKMTHLGMPVSARVA
jgi:hypothetical protein